MGQTLSEPITSKESRSCNNSSLHVSASSMQGWRINMEDCHVQLLSMPGDAESSFFAVFDGHGGVKVAQYASVHLHNKIVELPTYKEGSIEEALKQAFLLVDEEMKHEKEFKEDLAGSTAICVLIKDGKLYCANLGDSRAVASVGGRAEALSFDHKPSNESEQRRIVAAGGWVEFNRVNGNLALSRALGDFVFKQNDRKGPEEQIVTACPDIVCRSVTLDYEFIVMACDGIWDVLSNEEVVEFVRNRLAQQMDPETICEDLMTRCLAPDCRLGGLGCDNMTVIIVCLLHGGTLADMAERCKRPAVATDDRRTIGGSLPTVVASPSPATTTTTATSAATSSIIIEAAPQES